MKKNLSKNFLIAATTVFSLWSCKKTSDISSVPSDEIATSLSNPKELKDFVQVNLVGDNSDLAPANVDPNLINAWGIAFPTSGPAWVSSMGAGLAKVFFNDPTGFRTSVVIPSPNTPTGGHPTGVVFNNTTGTGFRLLNGNPARFIYAGADGAINGWNGGTTAVKMFDDAGDLYAGIALASDGRNDFLYIANFLENKIEVLDTAWKEVEMSFVDPNLPAGYGPFNIQNVGGRLYVMYAKIGANPAQGQVVSKAPGTGFIDVFNPDGSFVKRFVSAGQLNAPWGITKAPAGFWGEGSDTQDIILVGNFGDGHINAYNEEGEFQGQLRSHGNPIAIDGLWGIAFAPSTSTLFDHNQLFFAAGPGGEQHGLFGIIKK
jgi:uncharacterized protein (TIGR03118 family)